MGGECVTTVPPWPPLISTNQFGVIYDPGKAKIQPQMAVSGNADIFSLKLVKLAEIFTGNSVYIRE